MVYLGDKGLDRRLFRCYWNEVWKITSETLKKHNKKFFRGSLIWLLNNDLFADAQFIVTNMEWVRIIPMEQFI